MKHELDLGTPRARRDFWTDLDEFESSGDYAETREEAEDFHARVAEEVRWKERGEKEEQLVAPVASEDVLLVDNSGLDLSISARPESHPLLTAQLPSGVNDIVPDADSSFGPPPSFHSSHILQTSTPRAIAASSTIPFVPTPADSSAVALLPPATMTAHSPARITRSSRALDTPEYIASPIDTPTSITSAASTASANAEAGPSRPSFRHAGIGEGRGRRDDPATPVPLGKTNLSSLKSKKDLQAVTKHFDLFAKSLAKGQLGDTANGSAIGAKGKGRGRAPAINVTTGPAFGGKVFDGLRFCIPPEVNQVTKHKQRWEIISKLGGQVTLQPDTAITHVIYDAGRSASLLAQRLGLQALSELPEGTICVKWEWVVQCKMAGTLLDPSPWFSFPKTSFSRTVSANAVRATSRMFDITDRLRAQSVSITRKREPTASDSDTEESAKKRSRAADARSAILFPPTIPEAVDLESPMASEATDNIFDAVATDHVVSDGPRWIKAVDGDRDALDDMIDGVKEAGVGDAAGEASDDDVEQEAGSIASRSGLLKGKGRLRAEHFKCGHKNDGMSGKSPNEWLAQRFEALYDVYQGQVGKSAFAIRGYQRAAGIMRRIDYPITTGAQARAIPGIGTSLADRVDEFLSGTQGRAFYEDTEQARCVALFKDIYGVGRQLANKLYQRGARSISDLRVDPASYGLNLGQKIGLDLYDDLRSRIPREECRQIFELIQGEAEVIDGALWVEIMGSYRRGQEDSGDVDILITRDTGDGVTHQGVLKKLVQQLKEKAQSELWHMRETLIHRVQLSTPHDWTALETKWMGVGRVGPGAKYRRIDILCIPFEQWGAALIYFTGNEVFNRSLRLYARKLGYNLNQRGLYKGVIRDKVGTKTTEGEMVASRTEQEIFDVLGVRWRHPHHRRP